MWECESVNNIKKKQPHAEYSKKDEIIQQPNHTYTQDSSTTSFAPTV